MIPVQSFATRAIADVIRRQPSSPGRTAFAWQLAVGAAMARAATVELKDGVLIVTPRDPRWAAEIKRAADTILARLRPLLGPDAVRRVRVLDEGSADGTP